MDLIYILNYTNKNQKLKILEKNGTKKKKIRAEEKEKQKKNLNLKVIYFKKKEIILYQRKD